MQRQHLIVMLKEPRAGRVKTRLGRDIGMVGAAWWFRHQTRDLLRRLEDPRWSLTLAIAPDRALMTRAFPVHMPRVTQGAGDLGRRMARVFSALPPGPALIVGGDIPGITPTHIARAFAALGARDAVFGPADDGGYWLIGLKHRPLPAGALTEIRWSTEHALADTVASLAGLRIAYADTLRDVDTAADLKALQLSA